MSNPTEPFPVEPIAFGELPPIVGHAAIQGESPIDEVDVTFDWKHHLDGSISDFRVTRGVFRYPELKPLPRWKRFLARLLLGGGWVHFRFTRPEPSPLEDGLHDH